MMTTTMTQDQAKALITDLEGKGYKFQGGYGVECARSYDLSGGRWGSADEIVDVEWRQPVRLIDRRRVETGPAIVIVNRYTPSIAA